MDLNRENMKKISLLVLGAVFLYWGLNNMSFLRIIFGTAIGMLSPFILGFCIAFILNVPMDVIERRLFRTNKKQYSEKKKKVIRVLSLSLTILLLIVLVVLVIFIIFPELGRTFATIRQSIPSFLVRVDQWATKTLGELPEISTFIESLEFDWQSIATNVFNFLKSGMGSIVGSTVGIIGSVFSGVTTFVLGFIFAAYVLMQKETLARQSKKILYAFLKEDKADYLLRVASMSDRVFTNFISGQCLEAVILGSMFFISMSLFRFPYALLVAVLVTITALIPIFGAFIGCFVGAFLILVSNPMQALWFIILFLVLQQIEGNLIYPHVVGSSVGLPGIWVMVAVTVGGSAFGIIGMLVMVPICSVLYALFREFVGKRLKRRTVSKMKYS